MRRVLLGSLAVHVVVIAVVRLEWDTWVPARTTVVEAMIESPAAVPLPEVPEVIDVVFVADEPVAVANVAVAQRVAIASRSRGSEVIASSHEVTGTRGSRDPHMATQHLTMRGPELHPDDAQLAHIADTPGHEPPSALIPSKRLVTTAGGHVHIDDEVTTITVDRDGTAHLHDKPDLEINFALNPIKIWHDLKNYSEEVAVAQHVPEPVIQPRPEPAVYAQAIRAVCDQNLRDTCDDSGDGRQPQAAHGLILDGKFDETSYLMRKLGLGDAFASRKLAVLDATRLERAELGAQFKQAQLDRSAQQMLNNLAQVWRATPSPLERKVALFELWDECAEGEGAIAEAGERARKIVIGWIRVKLPAGTPMAFTRDELAALDKRRSSRHSFAPYAE